MSPPFFKIMEVCLESKDDFSGEICRRMQERAAASIAERDQFVVGVSGGSMASFVCSGLHNIKTDWSKWRICFCDERLVPLDSPDSTLKLYLDGLDKTPLTREKNFIEVNTDLEPEAAAEDYEKKLRALFAPDIDLPQFDLLLLGVGPDGHTASLFPGHELLKEEKKWVGAVSDSPKPPPCRVTLTLPAINRAKHCIFAFAGEGKKQMVQELKRQYALPLKEVQIPAAMVRPSNGEVIMVMDKAANS